MRAKPRTRLCAVALVVGALSLSAPRDGGADKASTPVVIVASKRSPIKNLSSHELRRLVAGGTVTRGGKRIVFVNLRVGAPARAAVDKEYLGMSGGAVKRFWTDQRVRGGSKEPRSVRTETALLITVHRFSHVVGYVPAGAKHLRKVKQVRVDGKLASDPGYPLFAGGR